MFGDEPEEGVRSQPAVSKTVARGHGRRSTRMAVGLFGREPEEGSPTPRKTPGVGAQMAPEVDPKAPFAAEESEPEVDNSSTSSAGEPVAADPPVLSLDWPALLKLGEANFMEKSLQALPALSQKRPYDNSNRLRMAEASGRRRPKDVLKSNGLDEGRIARLSKQPACDCPWTEASASVNLESEIVHVQETCSNQCSTPPRKVHVRPATRPSKARMCYPFSRNFTACPKLSKTLSCLACI